jgi:hypothetical protein
MEKLILQGFQKCGTFSNGVELYAREHEGVLQYRMVLPTGEALPIETISKELVQLLGEFLKVNS